MLRARIATVCAGLVLAGCGGSQLDAATRAQLPRSGPRAAPQLAVSRSDTTFPVSGASKEELMSSIRDYASANWSDSRAAAMTSVSIGAELQCQEYSDGGALTRANVKLGLVVYLPEWPGAARAAPPLRQAWGKLVRALGGHENGHVEIAKKHAAALREELAKLTIEPSCEEMLKLASDRVKDANERQAKAQRVYDDETRHGVTQGCVL
jgi:predicted secreted Zn-dependent protease